MATGDIRIDSLLALPRNSLATGLPLGQTVEITYSFSGYSQAQVSAIESVLAEISSSVGVSFRQVDQSALLTYSFNTDGPTLANGSPSTGSMHIKSDGSGVMIWLNPSYSYMQVLDSGFGRQIAFHETAHALGLKHPGQYSSNDNGPYLPTDLATANHTIMAYDGGNNEHLGDFDILALQYLYGSPGHAMQTSQTLVSVSLGYNSGTYFNDLFTLDVSKVTSSVSIAGLTGVDKIQVNLASNDTFFQGSGLDQVIYKQADGNYAGIFLYSVERIQFTDRTLALDIEGNAGQAYRLYKAAFDRTPDIEGLSFWLKQIDKGASLESVAAGFVSSQEFQNTNGASPTNLQLVSSLYQHILDRAPDQSGLDFWTRQLDTNSLSKSNLLVSFSESNENKIALTGQVAAGIEYIG